MTIQPIQTGKTTVKSHKGGRIWIEGGKLLKAGFIPGERYSFDGTQGMIQIKLDSAGALRVSGKDKRPIVDLVGSAVSDAIGIGSTVEVRYYDGVIHFNAV